MADERDDDGPVLYTPKDRAIFRYDRGDGTVVCGDPLMLDMKLKSHAMAFGGLEKLYEQTQVDAATADPIAVNQAYQAIEAIAQVTVTAFDLVPFDSATGQGATTAMARALYNAFQQWLEKKNRPGV